MFMNIAEGFERDFTIAKTMRAHPEERLKMRSRLDERLEKAAVKKDETGWKPYEMTGKCL